MSVEDIILTNVYTYVNFLLTVACVFSLVNFKFAAYNRI